MSFFDAEAKEYDSWYLSKEGKHVIDTENKLLESLLGSYTNSLDIGCGTGVHTKVLAKHSINVIGIDISSNMLEEAKKKEIKNATFKYMDALHTEFQDQTFDCVLSMAALEFIHDKSKFFDECFRILKPGGTLIIGTIQHDSLFGEMYRSDFFVNNTVFKHASFLTKKQIKQFYKEYYQDTVECLFNSYENISNNPEIDDIPNGFPGGFMISTWKKGE